MATDANMNANDYGFDDDDDDYYSCLSEMAPIASSENIFGFRTNIESGQCFDCKLVNAKFDQDEKRFSQEPDLEKGEILSAHLLVDEDNTGHGLYVEDIPLPSGKESTDGDLLTRIRRKFQLSVPSEEIMVLTGDAGYVSRSPSRISSSDKDILVTWKCQKFFDSIVESFDEESDDERTSDFNETFPEAAPNPKDIGSEFWQNNGTRAPNNEPHYIHSELVSENAKGIVTSDCVIAEDNISSPEQEICSQQCRKIPVGAVDLTQTPAVTDLGQSSTELTEVWMNSEEDKVSPTVVVIGRFLVRTVSENVLCQSLQKETVLKPGTSDNSGLDYLRDHSGIDALDKPPVERIPETGTENEDNSSTEKPTKKKGFFRNLFSCVCPCLRKNNPKMKTSDKVAKKITCSANSELIMSKV